MTLSNNICWFANLTICNSSVYVFSSLEFYSCILKNIGINSVATPANFIMYTYRCILANIQVTSTDYLQRKFSINIPKISCVCSKINGII